MKGYFKFASSQIDDSNIFMSISTQSQRGKEDQKGDNMCKEKLLLTRRTEGYLLNRN